MRIQSSSLNVNDINFLARKKTDNAEFLSNSVKNQDELIDYFCKSINIKEKSKEDGIKYSASRRYSLEEIMLIKEIVRTNTKSINGKRIAPLIYYECDSAHKAKLKKYNKELLVEKSIANNMLKNEINENKSNFAKEYNHYLKSEKIQLYIEDYHDKNPKMCEKLYNDYYLQNLPKDIQINCKNLIKEFGTYIFLPVKYNNNIFPKIENELFKWKKAGREKAILPSYIRLSPINKDFVENKATAIAYSNEKGVLLKNEKSIKDLRHEMMHLNDKIPIPFGIFNGMDFKKGGKILKEKQWFRNELENAGIKEKDINYAYKNKEEFIAVASEGDLSKYSLEFKKCLIKLGMPRWVFDLDKT